MKTSRMKHVGASLAVAFFAVACNTDKLTNLNKNPNNPEDVPAATLFTAGVVRGVNLWLGGGYNLRGAEFVTQHLAQAQYPDEDRYTRLGGGATQTYFDNPYIQELADYQKVIVKGTEAGEAGVYGPALVMRTWEFGYLTNTWGDVPYSDALRGDEDGFLSPKYDAQKDIYTGFFATLDKASKDMAAGQGSLGGGDPIYGGNTAAWQKFSNSLRARFALQLVNVDAATTRTQLAAAFSAPGGVFTSNADNAQLVWPGDGIYNNPWAANFATRDDHRLSRTLLNPMKAMNDPRLAVFAQPTPANPAVYAGAPNGLVATDMAPFVTSASRPGAVFYPGNTAYGFYGGSGNTFPSFLMTYAEVEFLKAEVVERGLATIAGSAASHYVAGIRASMEQWGVPEAQIAAFLAQPDIAYKGGVAGLRQIALQKWIALYTDGGTAWSEWRRTCVPETVQPGRDASQSTVPRRFQYSITEKSVNIDNVNAALSVQGPDTFSSRMYWDKNPSAAPTWFAACGVRGQAPAP